MIGNLRIDLFVAVVVGKMGGGETSKSYGWTPCGVWSVWEIGTITSTVVVVVLYCSYFEEVYDAQYSTCTTSIWLV